MLIYTLQQWWLVYYVLLTFIYFAGTATQRATFLKRELLRDIQLKSPAEFPDIPTREAYHKKMIDLPLVRFKRLTRISYTVMTYIGYGFALLTAVLTTLMTSKGILIILAIVVPFLLIKRITIWVYGQPPKLTVTLNTTTETKPYRYKLQFYYSPLRDRQILNLMVLWVTFGYVYLDRFFYL